MFFIFSFQIMRNVQRTSTHFRTMNTEDPFATLKSYLLQDQQWNCSILFNEEAPSSKITTNVDLLQKIKYGDVYIFPSRFDGVHNKKKLIVELKIATIKSCFSVCSRSSKSEERLIRENSEYCAYV